MPTSHRILVLGLPDQGGGLLIFLHCWRAWRRKRPGARALHYVLVLPSPPSFAGLTKALAAILLSNQALQASSTTVRQLQVLQRQLARQFDLAGGAWHAGFQRLELDKGRVLLTVCIGPLKTMLKAQNFLADELRVSCANLADDAFEWDRWTAKALAQRCQPGCLVRLLPAAHGVAALLTAAGFSIQPRVSSAEWRGEFAPLWRVKSSTASRAPGTSDTSSQTPAQPDSCLVIGHGLAGAATAAALARRGWQVQVLDAGVAAVLPLALFCPHVSKNDAPLSRLVRAGISLLTQRLPHVLARGRDWALTGAMQIRFEKATGPANLGAAVGQVRKQTVGKIWHAQAGWVKPQALVQAFLATPGVQVLPQARVQALRFERGLWQALDAGGACLAQAPTIVLASAGGTVKLLPTTLPTSPPQSARLASLHAVHGQISWGYQAPQDTAVLPRHPINGHGHLSAHIPQQRRRAWYVGATYETASANETGLTLGGDAVGVSASHQRNLQRLQILAPEQAAHLADRFNSGNVHSWRGTRFATRDRLPLVGPWLDNPHLGLWVNTGLGSRGLSWCLLTAELLAAQLGGEPLPIDAQLASKLAL